MNLDLRDRFSEIWKKYFKSAVLPLAYFYTDEIEDTTELIRPPKGEHSCFLVNMSTVLAGRSIAFDTKSFGCGGGRSYTGFKKLNRPNFEYFLSCGIEGKMEGERYKKTPELAQKFIDSIPDFNAPGKYLVFKRWDKLTENDSPAVIVFFATPDVLSGLFTLANFDEPSATNVITPFSSGCGSIINIPYVAKDDEKQYPVLGMFDVSARTWVPENTLSFAVSMIMLTKMIDNVDESFLITESWAKVAERIGN
jgi:uncharacterized protein (DUF169 family)